MPVVTEVMDPRQVELVERYADMFQIGARNMQNFDLLKEVGQTQQAGAAQARHERDGQGPADVGRVHPRRRATAEVILCERGVRTFEDSTRNMLDLSRGAERQGAEPPADHRRPQPRDRPARPDPGDGPGGRGRGRDGVHIEVHNCPEKALSDGPQALLPDQYARLMDELRQLAESAGQDDRRLRGSAGLMRPLLIAGNWKMNPSTPRPPSRWPRAVKAGRRPGRRRPRGGLPAVRSSSQQIDEVLAGSPIGLGAQNMHWEARRGLHRRDLRGDAPATSAAPTSSSATASGGTSWARPTPRSTRRSTPPWPPG